LGEIQKKYIKAPVRIGLAKDLGKNYIKEVMCIQIDPFSLPSPRWREGLNEKR
jgi:hypothetical protein